MLLFTWNKNEIVAFFARREVESAAFFSKGMYLTVMGIENIVFFLYRDGR